MLELLSAAGKLGGLMAVLWGFLMVVSWETTLEVQASEIQFGIQV
jgi:hypothetical protein